MRQDVYDFARLAGAVRAPDLVLSYATPCAARFERVIGTIRRECLDHVIIFGEAGLYQQVRSFAAYYQGPRTHLSLAKDSPEPRAVQPPELGRIVAISQVGGLHHRYERRAA
jgi:putative transposase